MGNGIEPQSPTVEEDGGLEVFEASEFAGCLIDGPGLQRYLLPADQST